jgi:hypothetical protein
VARAEDHNDDDGRSSASTSRSRCAQRERRSRSAGRRGILGSGGEPGRRAFLFIAQWFPKLGVYENGTAGTAGSSTRTPSSSPTTARTTSPGPAGGIRGRIGASGVPAEPSASRTDAAPRGSSPVEEDRRNADSTGKHPLVHDFAWTADPRYQVLERTFRYDEWAARYPDDVARTALALGRGIDEIRLRDVAVTVLVHPEHAAQGERHFEAACTALFFYGLWFGGYPYEHVTVVDPAYGAGAAGGMEYPTLFTRDRGFATPRMLVPESVTVHECGHQFWYGLVGNNDSRPGGWTRASTPSRSRRPCSAGTGSQVTTDFGGIPFDGRRSPRARGRPSASPRPAALRAPGGKGLRPIERSGSSSGGNRRCSPSRATIRGSPTGPLPPGSRDRSHRHARLAVRDRRSYRTNSYRRRRPRCDRSRGVERFLRDGSTRAGATATYPQDFFDAFQEGAGGHPVVLRAETEHGDRRLERRVAAASRSDRLVPRRERHLPEARNGERDAGDWSWIDLLVRRKGAMPCCEARAEIRDGRARRSSGRARSRRTTWWKPLEGRDLAEEAVSAVLDPERVYEFDKNQSDNQRYDRRSDLLLVGARSAVRTCPLVRRDRWLRARRLRS